MDISKIYESTYKNTYPKTNELAKLSQLEKNSFANMLESELKNIEKTNNQQNIQKYELNEKLLREQTDAFEAFMIKNVLDISVKLENPLYGKDAADNIYGSMYNDTMSKALSGGMGYSDILFNFLRERV